VLNLREQLYRYLVHNARTHTLTEETINVYWHSPDMITLPKWQVIELGMEICINSYNQIELSRISEHKIKELKLALL